jgi:hypothetical protein
MLRYHSHVCVHDNCIFTSKEHAAIVLFEICKLRGTLVATVLDCPDLC